MHSTRLAVVALCVVPVLAATSARAEDLTITFKVTSRGNTSTSTQYLTADKMRTNDGDHDTIVDFAAGKIVNVDHKRKEYSELTFDQIEQMLQSVNERMAGASAQMQEAMKNMPPAVRERMGNMGGMMGGAAAEATVTKGGTRTIAGYETQEYVVEAGDSMHMEEWTTTALKLPMSPATFQRVARFANPALQNPMMRRFGQMAEKMKQIEGYPLAQTTRMSMMGHAIETSREATAVTKGAIPASTFEIPAGYKKVDAPLNAMQRGAR